MRRLFVFFAPVVAGLALFACEDDPSGNPFAGLPEAGGLDANRPTGDGSLPDATRDGEPSSAPVSVTVTSSRGAAVPNVTVVFHDASGAVLEAKKTGNDGKATSAPPPAPTPAMATVVFGEATAERHLLTWTGLAAGDDLPVVAPVDPSALIGQYTITLPAPVDGGANFYARVGGCETYSTVPSEPISVFVYPDCYRGHGAVMVKATDGSDVAVGFSSKKGLAAVTDGGVLAVAADAYQAPTNVTVSATNTTNISGTAYFHQIASNTIFEDRKSLGGAFQAIFQASGGGVVDAYNAAVSFEGTVPQTTRTIGRRLAPSGAVALDANQLPPELTGSAIDATNKRRPIVSWTGDMGVMKGGVVRIAYIDGLAETGTHWSIVVPANASANGTVTAPALPAALDAILPAADAGGTKWAPEPEIIFADSDLVADYAAFRRLQGVVLPSAQLQSSGPEGLVLPQTGTFRVSHWQVFLD